MKRKVVQQGPSTLMISLPSKWVKENSISKGDELDIKEEKGKIVLSVEERSAPTTKEIHTDDSIFNKYFINYFYQKGYDNIIIRHTNPEDASLIHNRIKDLMGFEITEQNESSTTIKMLMKVDDQEFGTVLKKLFQITLVMGDKLNSALEQKNFNMLPEIKNDEKENNRYCDLCIRILYKNKYSYPDNGFAYFALIRELEQVGDFYKYLTEVYTESTNLSLTGLYKEVHDYFRLYYELYYNCSKEKAEEFFEKKKALLQKCQNLTKESTKEDLLVVSYLTSLTNAIFNLKGPMFLTMV
ncbi:hypothetical protein COV16_04690 [Candidatus Woesearchaeota archaeon CG10_big_fil_rev_8_21_14_0_10_34_8]|nr:MAG: hypothetical protein COV16_04690 [Candidatus Woesearchaeota archaeon CG10_big_fil_rev_8_21_14_0_10_34_8]